MFNPFQQIPQFQPSGRQGIGGSSVPLSSDVQRRFFQMAQMSNQQRPASTSPMPFGQGPQGPQQMQMQNAQFKDMTIGGAGRQLPAFNDLAVNGGVRPGVAPEMNAVEAARAAQGQPKQPPQGAALQGYMNGR